MNTIDNEITFKEVLLIFKDWIKYYSSKWILISSLILFGAFLGIYISIISKPKYSATISFVIEDDKSQGGGLSGALGLASQFGVDLGGASSGSAFSGANLLELMKSRSLIEKTLLTSVNIEGTKTTLAEMFIFLNKWRTKWGEDSDIGFFSGNDRSKMTLKQDSVLGQIYKIIVQSNLSIKQRDKKLGIIDASFISQNQLFSKKFIEVLVEVVSGFYIDTKTKKTTANVAILQRQTDSIRSQLNSAIGNVAQGLDATYNLNPAMSFSRLPAQKKQIDVQANSAILIELTKNLELAKISLRKETPLIQVIDYPILPLEKQKLGKKKGALMGGLSGACIILIYLTSLRLYKQNFS